MSAPRTYVVAFSDMRRFQTTVSGGSLDEAIESARELWDGDGLEGEHPFEMIDDCTFDQPEARIEDAPPPEREWTVTVERLSVLRQRVLARNEFEAIGMAKSLPDAQLSTFERDDIWWSATPSKGGASCR